MNGRVWFQSVHQWTTPNGPNVSLMWKKRFFLWRKSTFTANVGDVSPKGRVSQPLHTFPRVTCRPSVIQAWSTSFIRVLSTCTDVRRGFQPTGLHPSRSLHWVGVSCSLRPALPGGGSGLLQGGGRCQEEAGRENAAQHLHLSGVIWPDLNQRLSVCPVIERLLLRGFPDFRRHAQLQEERLSTGQTCLEGAEEETGRSSLRTWRGGLWGPGRRGLYAIKPLLSFMLTHMDVRQSVGFHSFHLKPL